MTGGLRPGQAFWLGRRAVAVGLVRVRVVLKRAGSVAKRKLVEIDRGLFLIRYATADDEAEPPTVRVAIDPSDQSKAMIILHPEAEEAVLHQPGAALAVRAMAPVKLMVEVTPLRDNGPTAATVKVEALTQGTAAVAAGHTSALNGTHRFNVDDLRILGHVAGIGDVVVPAREWLAGPTAPSRIEGIAIEWPRKPTGIDIQYAVKLAKANAQSAMVGLGSFAGTRGRALPITGIVIELTGRESEDCQLTVEALFLGSPAVRSRGQRIVVSGPTAREPLVGLRVDIEPRGAAEERAPTLAAKARAGSKVRVFRSRLKSEQAAV
jgi:hypothetical protein